MFQTLFTLSLLFCSLTTLSMGAPLAGSPVKFEITPTLLSVDLNTEANFTCTLPCSYKSTHGIKWLIGNEDGLFRQLDIVQFTKGLSARITEELPCEEICEDGSTCDRQTLSINVDSLALDKTPVQCKAMRIKEEHETFYSEYSVLRVSDPTPEEVVPVTADCRQTVKQDTEPDVNEEIVTEEPDSSKQAGGNTVALQMMTTSSSTIISPKLVIILFGLIAHYLFL